MTGDIMRSSTFAIVVAMVCAFSALGRGLEVEASFPFQSTLPGVAVELALTLHNRGTEPVITSGQVIYEVTPEGKHPFFARMHDGIFQDAFSRDFDGDTFALRPGDRETFYPHAGAPRLFEDPRLSSPGRYAIAVGVHRLPAHDHPRRLWPDSTSEPPARSADFVWSEPAVLQVRAPQGADAVVWRRLCELSKARDESVWTGRHWSVMKDVAGLVWEQHRDSIYAQVALQSVELRDGPQTESALKMAILIDEESPHADELRAMLFNCRQNRLSHRLTSATARARDVTEAETLMLEMTGFITSSKLGSSRRQVRAMLEGLRQDVSDARRRQLH